MKNAVNRYAQLVEAQSPEPQEIHELTKIQEPQTLPGANHKTSPSPSDNCSPLPTKLPPPTLEQVSRKVSQCDSQMSTSFASSADSHQISIPSENENMQTSQAKFLQSDTNKSISGSMMNLDSSNHLGNFILSWTDLTYEYGTSFSFKFKKKSNLVLRSLSGQLKSNQLVAIMGPSGCGKTTLLQFLAGNIPSHTDKLRIIGLEEPKVAFIGQDDCLLPGLTARETLMYASRLQNIRCTNDQQRSFNHYDHVQMILDQLSLAECADRSITKLSGGQAKRVTIGQELLYPTNLLILDEVTSGLDASTSFSIVQLLKRLVSDNRYPMSIVMSIHQPSAKLFSVFDKVYVMSEGQCLYEGSCRVDAVNQHLELFGLSCPKYHNIADYLIEVACGDTETEQEIRGRLVSYQQKHSTQLNGSVECNNKSTFEISAKEQGSISINDDVEESCQTLMLGVNGSSLYESIERARRRKIRPTGHHTMIHLRRSLLRISRSSILTYLQFATYLLLGLQLATFYGPEVGKFSGCPRLPKSFLALSLSDETDENLSLEMRRIQENMNFLLVAIMTATFAALEITVITFPLEAKTIKREWRNGWYRVTSYFLGRTLADLPFQLLFVVAFCSIIFTLTGQEGFCSWRFISFVAIIIMAAAIAQTVGYMFGAMFMDNLPAAVFIAPLFIFPSLLFSGFFSRVSQIPSFYIPMTYLSHFRYAFDALLVSLYGFNRCNCDQETLTGYHASLENQTGTVRDMFKSLFGSNDCEQSSSMMDENSVENIASDTPSTRSTISMSQANPSHGWSSTPPSLLNSTRVKTLEDALVDSVFEHLNTTTTSDPSPTGNVMDIMVDKFTDRVTSMLNKQGNYGHEVPKQCNKFNSYLMLEFDLENEDLMFALVMLVVYVLLSRLVCLAILSITVAYRKK